MKILVKKVCEICQKEFSPENPTHVCPYCGSVLFWIWKDLKYRYKNSGIIYEGAVETIKETPQGKIAWFIGQRVGKTETIEGWVKLEELTLTPQ